MVMQRDGDWCREVGSPFGAHVPRQLLRLARKTAAKCVVAVTAPARFWGMNQPLSPNRLLSRFIAYQAALEAYRLTAIATRRWRGFRRLVDQALGAAGSVTHCLAEGNGHPPRSADRCRYQRYALGSALELESALDDAAVARLGDLGELAAARTAAGRSAALCTALNRRW